MYQYYFFNQISKNSLYDFNNSLNDGIFRSVHIKGFYFHFIAYLFFFKKNENSINYQCIYHFLPIKP